MPEVWVISESWSHDLSLQVFMFTFWFIVFKFMQGTGLLFDKAVPSCRLYLRCPSYITPHKLRRQETSCSTRNYHLQLIIHCLALDINNLQPHITENTRRIHPVQLGAISSATDCSLLNIGHQQFTTPHNWEDEELYHLNWLFIAQHWTSTIHNPA